MFRQNGSGQLAGEFQTAATRIDIPAQQPPLETGAHFLRFVAQTRQSVVNLVTLKSQLIAELPWQVGGAPAALDLRARE